MAPAGTAAVASDGSGDTSWIDATSSTSETMSHATTVFGQNWSRETPKAVTSAGPGARPTTPASRAPLAGTGCGSWTSEFVKMIPLGEPMIRVYRLHQSPYTVWVPQMMSAWARNGLR